MRFVVSLVGSGLVAGAASAGELQVDFEIPRLSVAEYHRPYVAIWIAEPSGAAVTDLAVLYDVDMANDEGETWLKDMRQWWRRSGRMLDMPVDGVSGPTRAPGAHQMVFDDAAPQLADLPAGEYALFIEASREVGGREMLTVPFSWPPAGEHTATVSGEAELGAVTLTLRTQNEE